MVSTVSAVRAVRGASAALVMSALAFGAVGCGGGIGREAAEPPSLASLLAKPSPTPTPPPASVIKAAVQAYVDGVNAAFRTGDSSKGLAASTPTCTCRDQLAGIATVYARHEHFVGTHIVIIRMNPIDIGPTAATVRLDFRVPASAIANAKGKSRPLRAGPPATAGVTVTPIAQHWLVSAITGLPVIGPRPPRSPATRPTPAPQPATNPSRPSGGSTGRPS